MIQLTAQHCDLFNCPFFQFAQLKKYAPETIEPMKRDYKAAWQDWSAIIQQVAQTLAQRNVAFSAPHIERWCNGWQVRAHFFAYFKYTQYQQDAAILSVLLNRRRLTVSLDWHGYKAAQSTIDLAQYNQWHLDLDERVFGDFDVWHGDADEYADYATLVQWQQAGEPLLLRDERDFFCIGKHLEREQIGNENSVAWIVQQLETLLPLYERCFE